MPKPLKPALNLQGHLQAEAQLLVYEHLVRGALSTLVAAFLAEVGKLRLATPLVVCSEGSTGPTHLALYSQHFLFLQIHHPGVPGSSPQCLGAGWVRWGLWEQLCEAKWPSTIP